VLLVYCKPGIVIPNFFSSQIINFLSDSYPHENFFKTDPNPYVLDSIHRFRSEIIQSVKLCLINGYEVPKIVTSCTALTHFDIFMGHSLKDGSELLFPSLTSRSLLSIMCITNSH
jgi:hypothetical protein